MEVPPALVERQRSHFHSFASGVDVILGLNGYIWVCKHPGRSGEELEPEELYANYNEPMSEEERLGVARMANCIRLLTYHRIPLNHTVLAYAYEAALAHPVKDLLKPEVMSEVAEGTKAQVAMSTQE